VANGILLGAYHWHQPWTIVSAIIANISCFTLLAKRFGSSWMSITIHSMQYLLTIPMILAIVLGFM